MYTPHGRTYRFLQVADKEAEELSTVNTTSKMGMKNTAATLNAANPVSTTRAGVIAHKLPHKPVFRPFGFGLSYTEWHWANVKTNASGSDEVLSAPIGDVADTDTIGFDVTLINNGTVSSDQVVQLYASLSPDFGNVIHQFGHNISVHFPRRQLCDYQKVFVEAGKAAVVHLSCQPAALAGWQLFHASSATVYFAAGEVSPSPEALARKQLVTVAVAVRR
jgi:hypothetical protein